MVEIMLTVLALVVALTDFPTAVVRLATALLELVTAVIDLVSETRGRGPENKKSRRR